jgi:hypothetical protein
MLLSFGYDANDDGTGVTYPFECGRHDRLPLLLHGSGFCEETNGSGEGA